MDSARRFLSTSQRLQGNMYQLIGGEASPYTGKVRSYLIYKKIPYERVENSMEIYAGFVKPKVGWTVIPVVVTPEKEVIQDSTDIINTLERRYPAPSINPSGAKQKVVSKILELLGDEWLVQPVMHYRWSFPENTTFLTYEFGRMVLPNEAEQTRRDAAEMAYGKFKGMLPVLGITEKSGPGIEASWKGLLSELSAHFDKHTYFLGGRPCIGDFAFGGMMYAHLYRDPVPGYLMKTTAPAVATWCEMMNGSLPEADKSKLHVVEDGFPVKEQHDESVTNFCKNDEIPETLVPMLRRMLTEFGPILLSTKKHLTEYIKNNVTAGKTKLPRLIGTHQYSIGGITETRSISPFNVWMWQQVTDTYQSLSSSEKREVDAWLERIPYAKEIATADLGACRVRRVKNFLHADETAISHAAKL